MLKTRTLYNISAYNTEITTFFYISFHFHLPYCHSEFCAHVQAMYVFNIALHMLHTNNHTDDGYFQGEKYSSHRLLRSVKNRFGSTDEVFCSLSHNTTQPFSPLLSTSELFFS